MGEIIFEVSTISPILCSYPGCGRVNGKVRQAKWMIRRVGNHQEPRPVCFMCKARLKAMLGADERRSSPRAPRPEGEGDV